MRPVFEDSRKKLSMPFASFVSSASGGSDYQSKLYRRDLYEKEAALIATGFSAVSVGFAYKVIETADLFGIFSAYLFYSAAGDSYSQLPLWPEFPAVPQGVCVCRRTAADKGRDFTAERVNTCRAVLKTGAQGGQESGYCAQSSERNPVQPLDSCYVPPNVISLLTAVGIIAMLIATYTPVFNWIGNYLNPACPVTGSQCG